MTALRGVRSSWLTVARKDALRPVGRLGVLLGHGELDRALFHEVLEARLVPLEACVRREQLLP
jgi:hypothetical protein